MKKLGLISVVLAALLLVSPALAVKHVPKEVVQGKNQMGIISKLKMAVSDLMRPLTTVGGYLCSTYPDDSGTCYSDNCEVECPLTVDGGCAIVVFDSNYERMHEKQISPGDHIYIDDTQKYENYYCSIDCQCQDDSYESVGCGVGKCEPDEMRRERECDCAEEVVCKWRDKCTEQDSDNDGIIDSNDNCPYENRYDCVSDQTFNSNTGCCEYSGGEADINAVSVSAPSSVDSGSSVSVDATVKNSGDASGETRVGCAIYADSSPLLSVFGLQQFSVASSECCPGDEFSSETTSFSLGSGESKTVTLSLQAPNRDSKYSCGDHRGESNWGKSFTITCHPFSKCFGGTIGSSVETNFDVKITGDSDGDGTYNRNDACPNTYGEKPNGCPKEGLPWMIIILGAMIPLAGGVVYYVK